MPQMSLLGYTDLSRIAERRVEDFLEQFKPKWLYVDWSGGKDSTAALAAVLKVTDRVVATFIHLAGQTHVDNARVVVRVAEKLGLRVYRMVARRPNDVRLWFMKNRPWEEAPCLVYIVSTVYGTGDDYWAGTLRYGFEAPLERLGGGKRWACALMKNKWLAERPPNGAYQGRPARFVVVGIRRQESPYRAKLWAGKIWQVFGERYQREPDVALSPIVDFSEADVWTILQRYGLYEIVRPQYDRWHMAPNCVLCPMMGREALQRAIANLPTPFLQHILEVAKQVRPRYKEGTWSTKTLDTWIQLIEDELGKRR